MTTQFRTEIFNVLNQPTSRSGSHEHLRGRQFTSDALPAPGSRHTSSRPMLTMKYSARVVPTFFALCISLEPMTPTSPGPSR